MTQAAKPTVRPLSPHLQVYRLPLAAWLSITHRITGIGLTIGTLLLVWWVAAAAYGPDAYATFRWFVTSPIGYLVMLGFSVSLFYHLCTGIRHLFWDAGVSLEIADVNRSNIVVLAGTVILTVIAWVLALS
jgi:succinate dehydrogenase / fumarate reductase cytochrome b subunit